MPSKDLYMKKIFSHLLLGIGACVMLAGLMPAKVEAAGPPQITGILSFKEVTFGGGDPVLDRIYVGYKSLIIQGENLLPTSIVRINNQQLSPSYTSSDPSEEIAVDIPGGAKLGKMVIEVKLADGTYIGREYQVEAEPGVTPTPVGSTPTPTVGATPTPKAGGTSDSNLTCTEQGLVKDPNTGLCLPANPFGAQTGTLAGSKTIGGLIKSILDILLTLGGIVAILFIVIGGYQYVTSRGSESQAKEGRQTITYAIIGLVAILLAYMLVTVVTNLFTQGSLF